MIFTDKRDAENTVLVKKQKNPVVVDFICFQLIVRSKKKRDREKHSQSNNLTQSENAGLFLLYCMTYDESLKNKDDIP